jgi:hypothetical protein
VLGAGGGGDVVGVLAIGRMCESLGTGFALGGVAWERMPIDPRPGPRRAAEIRGGRRLGDAAVLISPDEGATTPEGVDFSESLLAKHLGVETVLIDISGGTAGAAAGIEAAAGELGCDLAIHIDVGGDVLARGDEEGLASPLCDAVMLAAAVRAAESVEPLLGVLGPGCDGELSAEEVMERVAELAREGAWLGTWSVAGEATDRLEAAARASYTEASLQVVRCARGEVGEVPIRRGRRHVRLSPLGALCLFLDAEAAYRASPLAPAVAEAASIDAAREALAALGVRSELDYERTVAGEGP